MAIWRNLLGLVSGAGYRQPGLQNTAPGYYSSSAAVPVTLDSSLQLSAVWACVRLITESISSLPIILYQRNADGSRTPVKQHSLVDLFAYKVNRWQTKQEFFESIIYQFVMLGNSYAAVQRNTQQEVIALVPLMSPQMGVKLENNGDIQYRYNTQQETRIYSHDQIWHNKLFGNGIVGLSPIAYARDSLGIGQAAQTATTNIYRNGGKPSGILSIDQPLKPDQRTAVKENFSEIANGNSDRLFVLEAGMKFERVSMSPQDIELLSSRRFQVEDIARFFMVPGVLINDKQDSTAWGTGIEQIILGFYKFGLRPYLERLKSSMNVWLLTREERARGFEFDFDLRAYLQPGMDERIKTGKEAVTGGIMTPNEVRQIEGLAPKDGGDNLYLQQQNWPINRLSDPSRQFKDSANRVAE